MHSRKTFLAGALGSLVVLVLACDAEPSDDDDGASETSIDDADDDIASDDDDGGTPRLDPPANLKAPGDDTEPYCGDGKVDADEDCDDGPNNGPDRECNHFCRLNDCDLDEDGDCLATPQ